MSDPYEDRTRQGAELLDHTRPGWAEEIVTDRLAMRFYDRCIIGQLYGEYTAGIHKLLGSFGDAANFGFDLNDEELDRNRLDAAYRHLTDAWQAEIQRRVTRPRRE